MYVCMYVCIHVPAEERDLGHALQAVPGHDHPGFRRGANNDNDNDSNNDNNDNDNDNDIRTRT